MHHFFITYKRNESTSILTEANFSARNMLKTLEYLMGLFEQLPTALYMNMRIFYYDDGM